MLQRTYAHPRHFERTRLADLSVAAFQLLFMVCCCLFFNRANSLTSDGHSNGHRGLRLFCGFLKVSAYTSLRPLCPSTKKPTNTYTFLWCRCRPQTGVGVCCLLFNRANSLTSDGHRGLRLFCRLFCRLFESLGLHQSRLDMSISSRTFPVHPAYGMCGSLPSSCMWIGVWCRWRIPECRGRRGEQ